MQTLWIFDVSALLKIHELTDQNSLNELLDQLTIQIEKGRAGFPRAVVDELKKYARSEPITFWAQGLGKSIRDCSPGWANYSAVMDVVSKAGYDEGIENIDGSDSSIVAAAAFAFKKRTDGADFRVVSEDRGSLPLRPTMEQVCGLLGHDMVCTRDALDGLGLNEFLR
ncbi:hypothetical protein AB0I55_10100 [Actinocatenispora sera]|jgi:hypothetical protein|uniref:hypothetical protein n=1 Tax=Actinocatenispora sera TaxID=390989 RepID=UPI0033C5D693